MLDRSLLGVVFLTPLAFLVAIGLCLRWQGWRIYHRIGNYSIGLVTFFTQLEYQGSNFPGPNVLESKIASQPADLQIQVQVFRRRMRYLRRAILSYMGFLVILGVAISVVRKLSS